VRAPRRQRQRRAHGERDGMGEHSYLFAPASHPHSSHQGLVPQTGSGIGPLFWHETSQA